MNIPKCLYCGKPLRRVTTTHTFTQADLPWPTTREEAQRRFNQTVVGVEFRKVPVYRRRGDLETVDEWHKDFGTSTPRRPPLTAEQASQWVETGLTDETAIRVVSLWDGESWGYASNGMFCTQTCGFKFGLKLARAGHRLP